MRLPARARDLLYDPHVRVDVHTLLSWEGDHASVFRAIAIAV
jgi:hypothetical protein